MENLVMATQQQSSCIHTTHASTNRICEIIMRGLLAGLLVSMFGLTACVAPAPDKTPTFPTASIGTSPVAVMPSDTALSPLAPPTPGVISSPLPIATPENASPGSAPAQNANFDLAQVALIPNDMIDLFQAGYSVQQEYQRAGMRGLQVLYPTSVVAHTTGFAEGFETRVEVYDQIADARNAFNAATADGKGKVLEVAGGGEESRVTVAGIDDTNEKVLSYKLIVRDANVLILITVKTPTSLSTERLAQIMKSVTDRLTAKGS
jgi:hypothetical protein